MFIFFLRDWIYINLNKFRYSVYKHFNIIKIFCHKERQCGLVNCMLNTLIQPYLPHRYSENLISRDLQKTLWVLFQKYLKRLCIHYTVAVVYLLSCVQLLQSHGLWLARVFCSWDFPSKNTGVGCHHLQGIFLTQGPNLSLLHLQVDFFLPLSHQGNHIHFARKEKRSNNTAMSVKRNGSWDQNEWDNCWKRSEAKLT